LKAQIRCRRLAGAAVPAGKRAESLPAVPTLDEQGFKSMKAPVWFGFVARLACRKEILARFVSDSARYQGARGKTKFGRQGLFPQSHLRRGIRTFIGAQSISKEL